MCVNVSLYAFIFICFNAYMCYRHGAPQPYHGLLYSSSYAFMSYILECIYGSVAVSIHPCNISLNAYVCRFQFVICIHVVYLLMHIRVNATVHPSLTTAFSIAAHMIHVVYLLIHI